MDWIIAQQLPEESGPYLASVKVAHKTGEYVFKAITYYNNETCRWYKYDPFEPDKELGEDITGKVVGWVNSRETFLG
ncbi:hypothetical protein Q4E93_29590 [Flavitalea sp. BT771]|uniref:hypothetical protein n=1 Tax=Flavitalea sp. BT771 TaxID=3063329 RepID=UPI0026E41111|nr:hypothetical protein [Flavitalea sp. BT771]MDO6434802.1 hypothetical protein [Flavitalea sp. BT771]MDV6223702.1 hypothetical protein [Flavitalea sp. BT771]